MAMDKYYYYYYYSWNCWCLIFLVALSLSRRVPGALGCFSTVFNLGDSLSDTGNILDTCLSNKPAHSCFPPYGETFFNRPTGRFTDGRLIIDFIAESLGIPLLQPYLDYLGRERNISIDEFGKGINFAVGGATALDASYFRERGVLHVPTNYTLSVQFKWFNNAYSSASTFSSTARSRKILKTSLVVVGEIGGNDYNHPLYQRLSFEEIKSFVPLVVKAIGSTVTELIKLGVENLMVPGNLPIGCSPSYLKIYGGTSVQDSENGCLNWLNQFSEYHNEQLQEELKRIRARHPHVHIIYADYYNSAMRLFNNPKSFGLTNTLEGCLVRGDETLKKHRKYGLRVSENKTVCDDPSKYVSWDGIHLTEAAYKLIATALLQGPYTIPQFKTFCISHNNDTTNLLQLQ